MSVRLFPLALAVFVACSGPFLVVPGGALEGEVAGVPPDWSFAGDSGTAQLETRPDDPYSVNVAYTLMDGALYINAGDTETQWAKNIAAAPEVRVRIDGTIYEMRAERVTDAAEIGEFGAAWTAQSMFRRDPAQLERVWLYRFAAR